MKKSSVRHISFLSKFLNLNCCHDIRRAKIENCLQDLVSECAMGVSFGSVVPHGSLVY